MINLVHKVVVNGSNIYTHTEDQTHPTYICTHRIHRNIHTYMYINIYIYLRTPTGVDEWGEVYTYTSIYISVFNIIDLFKDFPQALNSNDI